MSEDSPLLRNLNLRDDRILEIRPVVEEALGVPTWVEGAENDRYDATLEKILKFVHVQAVSLLIRRGTDEMVVLRSLTGRDTSTAVEEEHPAGESFSGKALHEGKTQFCNDIPSDPQRHYRSWRWWSDKLRPHLLQHGVFVPIAGDFELRGVLRFFNRLLPDDSLSPHGFTSRDRQVLEFLAKLAEIQINKIRLAERLTITSQSISSLHGRLTIEEVAQEVTRTGARLADVAAAAVFLPDPAREDSLKLYGASGFKRSYENLSIPRSKSLIGKVVQEGKPLKILDLQAAPGASSYGPGKTEGMASFLALPLGAKLKNDKDESGQTLYYPGVLVVYAKRMREFDTSTSDLLQQFALSAGTVIENHRRAQESDELRNALSQVAHSMRVPMNRIGDLLRKIQESGYDEMFPIRVQDAIENQQLADARLETMLFSRPGLLAITGLNRRRVNVYDLLKKCVARIKRFAWEDWEGQRRYIEIVLHDFSWMPEIHADADKLDIVFDNLIENAVKYSHNKRKIMISGEDLGPKIRVSVLDKGLGIPENMREKIFDCFARSDVLDRQRHISGTGLGLYVSKLIVEAHGGEITFKSVPFFNDPERQRQYEGYDTTFIVTLPKETAI